jgi:hypothetical protein
VAKVSDTSANLKIQVDSPLRDLDILVLTFNPLLATFNPSNLKAYAGTGLDNVTVTAIDDSTLNI